MRPGLNETGAQASLPSLDCSKDGKAYCCDAEFHNYLTFIQLHTEQKPPALWQGALC